MGAHREQVTKNAFFGQKRPKNALFEISQVNTLNSHWGWAEFMEFLMVTLIFTFGMKLRPNSTVKNENWPKKGIFLAKIAD
jgi:hypothetical protein